MHLRAPAFDHGVISFLWALFFGFLIWIGGAAVGFSSTITFIVGCVAGFLIWNFPPARIFMGDAGSGFLGCMVATLALWSSHTAPHLFWSWFILGGCFMVDSTVTLVRRVARGERFNVAHRSHAYQYAARRYASHKTVSIAFLVITAGWLFPLAVAVAAGRLDGLTGVAIAYAPLLVLAFRFKAGATAEQEI
jgi:Fuc2NAc and GlcNAc transferase